jgi:hypothetical protein
MQGNNGEEQVSVDSTSSREEINVNVMKILHAQQTFGFSFPIFLIYFFGVFSFSFFLHYFFRVF